MAVSMLFCSQLMINIRNIFLKLSFCTGDFCVNNCQLFKTYLLLTLPLLLGVLIFSVTGITVGVYKCYKKCRGDTVDQKDYN